MLNISLIGWRRSFAAVLRRHRQELNRRAARSDRNLRESEEEPVVDQGTYIEIHEGMIDTSSEQTSESLEADVAEFLSRLEQIVIAPGPRDFEYFRQCDPPIHKNLLDKRI